MTAHQLHPADEPPFDPDYDHPTKRRDPTEQPPHDTDAERNTLGSLLLAPHQAADVAAELNARDFYQPKHGVLWDAIHTVAPHMLGDLAHDAVLLLEHLTTHNKAARGTNRIDGPYLLDLVQNVVVPAPTFWASRVRDTARLRTVDDTATRLRALVRGGLDATTPDGTNRVLEQAVTTLDEAALRFGPSTTSTLTGLHDLTWILTGTPPTQPPPTWCERTDGIALFYAGKVNGIFGDPECGKTWLAQTAIVEALNAGQTAAMIDVDHNGPDATAARLLLLGANINHLADPNRFRYYEPEDADELRAATQAVTAWAPAVLILDSLGEVLPMLGVKSVDNDEITTALRLVCTPPANAGTCVITIDHLPKSSEARITGYAIGGTAKKRIMRGSYIRAEMRVQPAPGGIGKVTLRIEKDTVGELRKHTPGGYAGTLTIDSRQPHTTTWTIDLETAPKSDDGTFRPTVLMEKVSRYVEDNDLASFRDLKAAIGSKDEHLRGAIRTLINDGFLSVIDGPRRAKLHHSVAHYRQSEDDHIAANHTPPSTTEGTTDEPLI